jgi:hypothetical protein
VVKVDGLLVVTVYEVGHNEIHAPAVELVEGRLQLSV